MVSHNDRVLVEVRPVDKADAREAANGGQRARSHRRVRGGIRAGDAGLDLVEKEDRVSPRAAKDIRTAGPASESSAARRLFLQSRQIACRDSTKLRQFRDLERDLQGLNAAAWNFLKSELEPLLTAQDAKRGWQRLWDRLNQAKAYNHLKHAGYRNIEFIPPSTVRGQQTPDLRAELNTTRALCEVKTIDIAEIEAERRHSSGVGSTSDRLDSGFFTKMQFDIEQAKEQMAAYDPNPATKRLAYIVVKFDDVLHECGDAYRSQIDEFMASAKLTAELDVVFDIDPAFYAAMA